MEVTLPYLTTFQQHLANVQLINPKAVFQHRILATVASKSPTVQLPALQTVSSRPTTTPLLFPIERPQVPGPQGLVGVSIPRTSMALPRATPRIPSSATTGTTELALVNNPQQRAVQVYPQVDIERLRATTSGGRRSEKYTANELNNILNALAPTQPKPHSIREKVDMILQLIGAGSEQTSSAYM
jgi:hypothetical protein